MSDSVATSKRQRVADPLREYAEMVRKYHGTDVHGKEREYVTVTTAEMLNIANQIDCEHERLMERSRHETKRAFAKYLRKISSEYERGHKRKSWLAQQRMQLELDVLKYKGGKE